MLGNVDGELVGSILGNFDGAKVGVIEGDGVGFNEGNTDGDKVGALLFEGAKLAPAVGEEVGPPNKI